MNSTFNWRSVGHVCSQVRGSYPGTERLRGDRALGPKPPEIGGRQGRGHGDHLTQIKVKLKYSERDRQAFPRTAFKLTQPYLPCDFPGEISFREWEVAQPSPEGHGCKAELCFPPGEYSNPHYSLASTPEILGCIPVMNHCKILCVIPTSNQD